MSGGAFAFGDTEWPGLAKLTEECGEAQEAIALTILSRHLGRLGQVAGKLMMTHGDPAHWSGNLRTMLLDEIGDVEAAIVFFNRHNMTAAERQAMARRVTAKVAKFEEWHADFEADPPPALPCDSGRLPEGRDANAARCEASQSGGEAASPEPHRDQP